jgi:hypothetical protein
MNLTRAAKDAKNEYARLTPCLSVHGFSPQKKKGVLFSFPPLIL